MTQNFHTVGAEVSWSDRGAAIHHSRGECAVGLILPFEKGDSFAQAACGCQRSPGNPVKIAPRDRPSSTVSARRHKSFESRLVSFVLLRRYPSALTLIPHLHLIPDLDCRAAASSNNFNPLGGKRTVASGLVGNGRNATIFVPQSDEHTVVAALVPPFNCH